MPANVVFVVLTAAGCHASGTSLAICCDLAGCANVSSANAANMSRMACMRAPPYYLFGNIGHLRKPTLTILPVVMAGVWNVARHSCPGLQEFDWVPGEEWPGHNEASIGNQLVTH